MIVKCHRCEKELEWEERIYVANMIDEPGVPFCAECFEQHVLPEMTMTGGEYYLNKVEQSYGNC